MRGTGGGPEKTILLGAAQADPGAFAVTVCYIRDARDTVFGIDERAGELGVDYVEMLETHSFDRGGLAGSCGAWSASARIDIVHAHDYKTDLLAWLLRASRRRSSRCRPRTAGPATARASGRLYYPLDKWLLGAVPLRHRGVEPDPRRADRARRAARARRVSPQRHRPPRVPPRPRARSRRPAPRSASAPGDVVIGAVGRLEPQKRFDLLIEAFAALRATHPELRC